MGRLRIIFEDKWLVVAYKPEGLATMSTAARGHYDGQRREVTAYSLVFDMVRRRDPEARIFIVHRLDRETSGVVIFAKDQGTKNKLQENWEKSVLERGYDAVLEGVPSEPEGVITSWLYENPRSLKVSSSPVETRGSKKAVTRYKVISRLASRSDGRFTKSYSLVRFQLETGRKNQIRVHCAEVLGCPVAGDRKYGSVTSPHGRLCLNASTLRFIHPVTGEELYFKSPVPKEWEK